MQNRCALRAGARADVRLRPLLNPNSSVTHGATWAEVRANRGVAEVSGFQTKDLGHDITDEGTPAFPFRQLRGSGRREATAGSVIPAYPESRLGRDFFWF